MPLGHGHIEDLFQAPPQMIDGRERKALTGLAVEKILQLVALKTSQFPHAEHFNEMDADPVHVVHPCRCLPLAAIVGEVNLRDELAEAPGSVFLPPRLHLADDVPDD